MKSITNYIFYIFISLNIISCKDNHSTQDDDYNYNYKTGLKTRKIVNLDNGTCLIKKDGTWVVLSSNGITNMPSKNAVPCLDELEMKWINLACNTLSDKDKAAIKSKNETNCKNPQFQDK